MPRDSTLRPRTGGAPDTVPSIAPLDTAAFPDTVVLDRFAAFYPREQRVVLRLVAGFTGENDALNFNGGTHGSDVLLVPSGWQLELHFVNQDPTLSHSAIVIPNAQPLPVTVPAAAFPHASTARVEEGRPDGGTDVAAFVAAAAGEYMIACGVPGHAQGGMWIRLRVAPGQIPAYQRR